MNTTNKVLAQTAMLSVAELGMKLLGLAWTVLVARKLDVEIFGNYSYILAFIAVFSLVPDAGTGLVAIREIAQKKFPIKKYISTLTLLYSALSTITVGAIIVAAAFILPGSLQSNKQAIFTALLLAGFGLFFSSLKSVSYIYYQGIEKPAIAGWLTLLSTSLYFLGGYLGLVYWHSLVGIFAGFLIGHMVGAVVALGVVHHKIGLLNIQKTYDKKLARHVVVQGFPLGIAAVSAIIYSKVDTFVIQHFLDSTQVAYYSVATPFVFGFVQLLNVPFAMSVYPVLSRIFKEDSVRFKRGFLKSMLFVIGWSVPVSLALSLLAPFIISIFFGDKYLPSVPILQFVAFFIPLVSVSALLYRMLIIAGKQWIYMWINVFGAFLNAGINIMLVKQFGIMGSAYSLVLSQIILMLIYIVVVVRYYKDQENNA